MSSRSDFAQRILIAVLVGILALLTGCTAQRPPRAQLPVATLVSIAPATSPIPGSNTAEQAEFSRQAFVQWTPAALFATPFGVRHRAELFPNISFELVFDARLYTGSRAFSLAGRALNDPGSMAVLTYHESLFRLTVDSPIHGHFSVRALADGRYAVRENTGVGTPHGADDFGGPRSHLAYTDQVIDQIDKDTNLLVVDLGATKQSLQAVELEHDNAARANQSISASIRENNDALDQLNIEIIRIESEVKRLPLTTTPQLETLAIQIASLGGEIRKWRDQLAAVTRPPMSTKDRDDLTRRLRSADAEMVTLTRKRDDAKRQLARQNETELESWNGKLADASRQKKVALTRREELNQSSALAEKNVEKTAQKRAPLAARLSKGEYELRDLKARNVSHQRVRDWLQAEIDETPEPPAPMSSIASEERLAQPSAMRTTATAVAQSQAMDGVAQKSTSPDQLARHLWEIDATCADSAGRIDVAVLVSKKVMDTATATYGNVADATAHLKSDIEHGLNLANTALRNSGISTPGIDIGFALVNEEPKILTTIPDRNTTTAVQEAYSELLPPKTKGGNPGSLFATIGQIAPTADVVLVIIEGDGTLPTLRGMALGTPNPHGDSTKNQRVAVVKHAASVADHIYTFAHELGHTLGAGHFEAINSTDSHFQTFARGAVLDKTGKRWASLMAVSDCPATAPSNYSCRRVPYYSSPTLSYPDYGDSFFGTATQDNSGAMRFVRENVARLRCAKPALESSVWLRAGLAVPTTPESPPPMTTPWEAQSVWVLPVVDKEGRKTYAHDPAALGTSAFVNVMLHNPKQLSDVSGQLEIWRVKPAAGLLLSPRWPEDMESGCSATFDASAPLKKKYTTVVQVPCATTPSIGTDSSDLSRDSWVVRWTDAGSLASGSGDTTSSDGATLLTAALEVQPTMAWRSMRNVDLALGDSVVQTVLVRNLTNAPKEVNLRIQPAPNQFNTAVSDTGLKEIRFASALCRDSASPPCSGGIFSATEAIAYFDGSTTMLALTLPVGDSPIPVKLHFERSLNVPQQNVLLRVTEEEPAGKVLGGTTYVVRHSPKTADTQAGN